MDYINFLGSLVNPCMHMLAIAMMSIIMTFIALGIFLSVLALCLISLLSIYEVISYFIFGSKKTMKRKKNKK